MNNAGTSYGSDVSFCTQCGTAAARFGASGYGSLQAAATAAAGGGTIIANATTFGATVFENSGPVTLHGGYDCGFSSVESVSTVSGSITIRGTASVTIDNVVIQ
jgi:hypothetical protein